MSEDIIFEVNFFLHSFLMGLIITFVYDWFLILRRLIRHNTLMISLEDLVFWIACALGVFYMLYRENNGILRWFTVLGAAVGMLTYKRIVSTLLVTAVSAVIKRMVDFLLRPIIFTGKKIREILAFIFQKLVKILKYVKKKLTIKVKLVKMMLCKRKLVRQTARQAQRAKRTDEKLFKQNQKREKLIKEEQHKERLIRDKQHKERLIKDKQYKERLIKDKYINDEQMNKNVRADKNESENKYGHNSKRIKFKSGREIVIINDFKKG